MIPLIFLILGRAWEAAAVAIYGDPAHFADLRSRSGSIFFCDAIYGDPAHVADLRTRLGSSF